MPCSHSYGVPVPHLRWRLSAVAAMVLVGPLHAAPPSQPKGDGKQAELPAVAPEFDKTPLFDLSKGAGLPSYLKASANMLGDAAGLRDGEARVTVPDLDSKDFTFDVLF